MEIKELQRLLAARLKRYLSGHNSYESIREFCGVSDNTLRRWKRGGVPVGDRVIKLWVFLESNGFDSPERDKLPPLQRLVGDLIAFDVITVAEAKQILGYLNEQMVFKALRGTTVTSHPTLNYEQVMEMYGDTLAEKRELAGFAVPAAVPSLDVATPVPAADAVDDAEELQPSASVDVSVHILASLLLGAMPLAEWLASDSCTDEDRAKLREIVGLEAMQKIKSNIHLLTGKRARDFSKEGKQARW